MFKRRKCEEGQTLILGVLSIIVLLIATLIIFDLSSVIKTKLRSQTAVDAAALTGAKWQAYSLNAIGELNLVQVCTVIVNGIPPIGDDSPPGISESVQLVNKMQAQIAFVGPMIGFGAAQQAAKNNRIPSNSHYTRVVGQHIDLLRDNSAYGPYTEYFLAQTVETYRWRTPYADVVEDVCFAGGGIAVAPNTRFAGLPAVEPAWLMDLSLYDSITSRYWCYPSLRWLLKTHIFEGKWWDLNISTDLGRNFPYESEYLTLCTEFSGGGSSGGGDAVLFGEMAAERSLALADEYNKDNPDDRDLIDTPLPYVRWCYYESGWMESPSVEWLDGTYLRGGLKPEYAYGGAVTKMTSDIDIERKSGAYSANSIKSRSPISKSSTPTISSKSSAMAKPLGFLESPEEKFPPYISGMVLPVFDKSRLIPVAMQDPMTGLYDPFDRRLYDLYRFLIWLQDVDDIYNPGSSPPSGGQYFLNALRSLGQETWRSQGYNRNYVPTGSYPTELYDPDTNPTGAGWLQMGHTYQYDSGGNPIGVADVNEDTCDYNPDGVSGGTGPSIVH